MEQTVTKAKTVNPSDAHDALLVENFIGGDSDAFSSLVQRHQDGVCQFVRWYVGNGREADDIAQEVFVAAFKSLNSFRREATFKTWLYGLARNVCLYHVRKNGSGRLLQEDDGFLEIPDMSDHAADMEKTENRLAVRCAVDKLPSIYREILLLREWEQMSYEDIAAALQIPIGMVRSWLHNATVLLARKLFRQGVCL